MEFQIKPLRWVLGVFSVLIWVGPLIYLGVMAFAVRGTYGGVEWNWTDQNFARLCDPLYLNVFARTLALAFSTAVASVLLGAPVAYRVAQSPGIKKTWGLVLVSLPFWTGFLVKVYAIRSLFGSGALEESRMALPFGMISIYLPFAILPLVHQFEKFDWTLKEAAQELGASRLQFLIYVFLPKQKRAIFFAGFLVFTPALGEFVIPDILGGAKTQYLGNLLNDFFLKSRDWPMGASVSLLMLGFALLSYLGLRGGRER